MKLDTRSAQPIGRWTIQSYLGLLVALVAPVALSAVAHGQDGKSPISSLQIATQADVRLARTPPGLAAPARPLAPSPKLAEASCVGVTVTPAALSSFVFDDGFEGGDTSGWQTPAVATFSVRGVADLSLAVALEDFTGEALLRFELTSPKGHHYQSLEAPVVAASAANASGGREEWRRLDGYPHPVPVRFAAAPAGTVSAAEGKTQVASLTWPLAGTHVLSHGLYGSWTLSATLSAGSQSLVCPTIQFHLEP